MPNNVIASNEVTDRRIQNRQMAVLLLLTTTAIPDTNLKRLLMITVSNNTIRNCGNFCCIWRSRGCFITPQVCRLTLSYRQSLDSVGGSKKTLGLTGDFRMRLMCKLRRIRLYDAVNEMTHTHRIGYDQRADVAKIRRKSALSVVVSLEHQTHTTPQRHRK